MITSEMVLGRLAEEGYTAVVNTPYHIQVPHDAGKHDIWLTGEGVLKLKLTGEREAIPLGIKGMCRRLKGYDYSTTDQGMMEVIRTVRLCAEFGIFVDAGWKAGKARLAVIRKCVNGDMDVFVRHLECPTNQEAEEKAIDFALDRYPYPGYNDDIFTDNQSAAVKYGGRVKWIKRHGNRAADKLSHLRGERP